MENNNPPNDNNWNNFGPNPNNNTNNPNQNNPNQNNPNPNFNQGNQNTHNYNFSEQQINQQMQNQFGGNVNQMQQPLPNSAGVLVLGILSIVFCWLYGIPGLILGIIGLVMSNNAKKAYMANPQLYSQSSYNNMKAGRICAIIGTILSSLWFVYFIVLILFFAGMASSGFGRF